MKQLSIVIISAAVIFPAQTTLAQQVRQARTSVPMVNTEGLPHTQFPKAPLRVQVVDDGPIVTSTPYNPPHRSYVFQLDPSAEESTPAGMQKIGEGLYVLNPAPARVRRSNPMVDTDGIQPARFESNIPIHAMAPERNLPDATSSRRLFGRCNPTPTMGHKAANPIAATSTAQPLARPVLATYGPTTSVGSSQSSQRCDASVRGVLWAKKESFANRLLDKQN